VLADPADPEHPNASAGLMITKITQFLAAPHHPDALPQQRRAGLRDPHRTELG